MQDNKKHPAEFGGICFYRWNVSSCAWGFWLAPCGWCCHCHFLTACFCQLQWRKPACLHSCFSSACTPSLRCFSVLTLSLHSIFLLFTRLVPHLEWPRGYVNRKLTVIELKGTWERLIRFATLLMWLQRLHKLSKSVYFFFPLSFKNFFIFMMYVYLYAWEIMVTSWVCVCIMKKTTWNLLQSIKQKRRKHLQRVSRDARALCMTPHAFFLFFYFKCQVLFFFLPSFSHPFFSSVITPKSCTVFLSRSELLQ